MSCPEIDEFDSDSTEETTRIPLLNKRRESKRIFEDDKLGLENKYKSKEYEQILKKEASLAQFDKFDLYFEDCDDKKILDKNRGSSFKRSSFKTNSQEAEDEYNLLKCQSVQIDDQETKLRSSSILKRLENSLNEKK